MQIQMQSQHYDNDQMGAAGALASFADSVLNPNNNR
jgi:hypothetical protein